MNPVSHKPQLDPVVTMISSGVVANLGVIAAIGINPFLGAGMIAAGVRGGWVGWKNRDGTVDAQSLGLDMLSAGANAISAKLIQQRVHDLSQKVMAAVALKATAGAPKIIAAGRESFQAGMKEAAVQVVPPVAGIAVNAAISLSLGEVANEPLSILARSALQEALGSGAEKAVENALKGKRIGKDVSQHVVFGAINGMELSAPDAWER